MRWFLPDSILVTHFCIISLRASCLNYKSFKMLQLALLHCLLNVLTLPQFYNLCTGYQLKIELFQDLLLIFHCVQGSAPQYNISLVHPYIPARNLRSSTSRALIILNRLKHGGKEPSHMPGHIYGTAFLKTSRIVNHPSHLRITWKLTCLLIVNFVILFMCKSCLLSSLFFIAPWALCRVDLAHYKSYELYYYYYYRNMGTLEFQV